jgi:predicted amidohydrolase YtcJ
MTKSLTISNADVNGSAVDVHVDGGIVTRIEPTVGGPGTIDAHGGALIPGLHDHHIHLLAMAAARASIGCGPSHVIDAPRLAEALQSADRSLPNGHWIRGVGYHESVAGNIDRHWLDSTGITRPIRIQHSTGAMWILNTAALIAASIGPDSPNGVELDAARQPTGRLFRVDAWLRARIPRASVDLAATGQQLASYGITSVTDMTPTVDITELALLAEAVSVGALPFNVEITGRSSLPSSSHPELPRGPVKVVIDDHDLPTIDDLLQQFREARHAQRRWPCTA